MRRPGRTGDALHAAARDARRAWGPAAWLTAAALSVAAVLPPLVAGDRLDSLAAGTYMALAATGLAFAVGYAGMPSLSQGAFVGIGAFTSALLQTRGGWPLELAVLAAALVAGLAGALTGVGVVRLRNVFVAVSTWVLTWLVVVALAAFPALSGGAQGIALAESSLFGLGLTPGVHYEVALLLLALSVGAYAVLGRGAFGRGLSAYRQAPAAATALGVRAFRLRLGAFVASAAIGGLAGALSVQLALVADPIDYGPFLSFELLIATLVGGAASALGPTVGVAALALLMPIAAAIAALVGADESRFVPMLYATALLSVVALGGRGLVPALRDLLPRATALLAPPPLPSRPMPPARLEASGLRKRYGNVQALEGFDLVLRSGSICALIGSNGSGKTTALRLLAGTQAADGGSLLLDGSPVNESGAQERVRLGVVRTLQATRAFESLTALEHALVGADARAVSGGSFRTLFGTPRARRNAAHTRTRARAALAEVGLGTAEHREVLQLSTSERRLVMLAAALATEPRVLLVDELSAGATPEELAALTRLFGSLRDRGLAILLVEHNLRLVRSVADHVVVLEAGRRIAAGTPDEVAADPAVRRAYLGRQAL